MAAAQFFSFFDVPFRPLNQNVSSRAMSGDKLMFVEHRVKKGHAAKGDKHENEQLTLYRNNLKNRFLPASALPHNFNSHSRLAIRQWSLAPNRNSEEPPWHIPDSSDHFGIVLSGQLKISVEGHVKTLGKGDAVLIPSHMPHDVEVLEDSIVIEVFSPPRAEWLKKL